MARSYLLVLVGAASLAWTVYDATLVQESLGLTGLVSEAVVATAGLAFGLIAIVVGGLEWKRRRPTAADEVG